jgi:hypothetical protein
MNAKIYVGNRLQKHCTQRRPVLSAADALSADLKNTHQT